MVAVRPAPGLGFFVEDRRQQPLAEALAAVVGGDEEFGGVTITLESADSEADEGFTVEEAPDARGGLRLMGGVLTGGDGHESAGDLGGAIGHCHVIEELELILGEGVDRGGGDCSAGLDSHAVTSSESVSVTLSALKR